jgi:Fe-S-cluster-containing hydrogenase component 2
MVADENYLIIKAAPRMCNRCDDAPCIRCDHRRAIRKWRDGIVIIDPTAAKMRSGIPSLCPHSMIKWDANAAILHVWNFDGQLLDNGWSAHAASRRVQPRLCKQKLGICLDTSYFLPRSSGRCCLINRSDRTSNLAAGKYFYAHLRTAAMRQTDRLKS